jgi:hypothetical protein
MRRAATCTSVLPVASAGFESTPCQTVDDLDRRGFTQPRQSAASASIPVVSGPIRLPEPGNDSTSLPHVRLVGGVGPPPLVGDLLNHRQLHQSRSSAEHGFGEPRMSERSDGSSMYQTSHAWALAYSRSPSGPSSKRRNRR